MAARETTNPTFDKKHIIPERYLHLSDGEMIRKIYEKKRPSPLSSLISNSII